MKFLFFNVFADRMSEGGPTFMYPILLILIICIVLIIKTFLKGDVNGKAISLIKHLSLFGLVWGFLGQMIGLIVAFDSVEAFGNVSPHILAAGIKVALLSPVFGMVTFLIARLGIIGLIIKKK